MGPINKPPGSGGIKVQPQEPTCAWVLQHTALLHHLSLAQKASPSTQKAPVPRVAQLGNSRSATLLAKHSGYRLSPLGQRREQGWGPLGPHLEQKPFPQGGYPD